MVGDGLEAGTQSPAFSGLDQDGSVRVSPLEPYPLRCGSNSCGEATMAGLLKVRNPTAHEKRSTSIDQLIRDGLRHNPRHSSSAAISALKSELAGHEGGRLTQPATTAPSAPGPAPTSPAISAADCGVREIEPDRENWQGRPVPARIRRHEQQLIAAIAGRCHRCCSSCLPTSRSQRNRRRPSIVSFSASSRYH